MKILSFLLERFTAGIISLIIYFVLLFTVFNSLFNFTDKAGLILILLILIFGLVEVIVLFCLSIIIDPLVSIAVNKLKLRNIFVPLILTLLYLLIGVSISLWVDSNVLILGTVTAVIYLITRLLCTKLNYIKSTNANPLKD
jgi:hypothetical protein